MKKVLKVLEKYFIISIPFSILIFAWIIASLIRNNALPIIDLFFIIKSIVGIVTMAVILLPGIAIIDLLTVKSAVVLFKDFKEADRKGRIIIIVVFIMLLLRKIFIWTR